MIETIEYGLGETEMANVELVVFLKRLECHSFKPGHRAKPIRLATLFNEGNPTVLRFMAQAIQAATGKRRKIGNCSKAPSA